MIRGIDDPGGADRCTDPTARLERGASDQRALLPEKIVLNQSHRRYPSATAVGVKRAGWQGRLFELQLISARLHSAGTCRAVSPSAKANPDPGAEALDDPRAYWPRPVRLEVGFSNNSIIFLNRSLSAGSMPTYFRKNLKSSGEAWTGGGSPSRS
jgi:hypothetical protein